jgi:6-phosphogluconolactonase
MNSPVAGRVRHCQASRVPAMFVLAAIVIAAGGNLSCGNSNPPITPAPNHFAYVTLPNDGSVLLLQINGTTGAVTAGAVTPPVSGTTPLGLALTPSRQFLYTANGRSNTISIFSVANTGNLSLTGYPMQAGNGPDQAVVDPSGQYLLVTDVYGSGPEGGDISVYSINGDTGALTEVSGSPFPANDNPTQIVFTHSGQYVYVTNPNLGMVTGFAFCPTQSSGPACGSTTAILTPLADSPVFSGSGAAALAIDAADQYLYVANSSATNQPPYEATVGNVSAFAIDPNTGNLSEILGSPFTSTSGNNPTSLAIDPTGKFLYAVTPGSSSSVWCFQITATNGQLVLAANSPFSVAAGGVFAIFDPSGSFFYIGNDTSKGIGGYTYNSTTGALTIIKNSPFSTTEPPGQIVLSE